MSECLKVYASSDEYSQLRIAAATAGKSMSAWALQVLLQAAAPLPPGVPPLPVIPKQRHEPMARLLMEVKWKHNVWVELRDDPSWAKLVQALRDLRLAYNDGCGVEQQRSIASTWLAEETQGIATSSFNMDDAGYTYACIHADEPEAELPFGAVGGEP